MRVDGDWTTCPKKMPLVGGMYDALGRRKSGRDWSEPAEVEKGSGWLGRPGPNPGEAKPGGKPLGGGKLPDKPASI